MAGSRAGGEGGAVFTGRRGRTELTDAVFAGSEPTDFAGPGTVSRA